eukprot:m.159665 g.159665  ORF g.159665 m.159665 type:complete len:189 (-) comp31145_c0_seq1:153-719(-)
MSAKPISLVVAATEKWGIGQGGGLPWTLKGDMQFFKKITSTVIEEGATANAVVMGRKTWESIPKKFRPLAGRVNYVLTRSTDSCSAIEAEGTSASPVFVLGNLEAALEHANKNAMVGTIFIIGGATVYEESIKLPVCTTVYLTKVFHDFECDTFMPPVSDLGYVIEPSFTKRVQEGDVAYEYQKYVRP